jgi:hypothetical protein
MAKRKMTPEIRAQLEDIRREVRELIEYLQALRDSKR